MRRFTKDDGFSLLVIPVFFVVVSLFTISTLQKAEVKQYHSEVKTQVKQQRIQKALATFVHRNYRVPCPAPPDGTGANLGVEMASCDAGSREGIVPFRSLGLTEFDVRDEWGNYFTYNVSPTFAKKPLVGGKIPDNHYDGGIGPTPHLPVPLGIKPTDYVNQGSTATSSEIARSLVHEYCRRPEWFKDGTAGSADHRDINGNTHTFAVDAALSMDYRRNINLNSYKAQFCCASNVGSYVFFDFTDPGTEDYLKNNLPTKYTVSKSVPNPEDPLAPKSFTIEIQGSNRDNSCAHVTNKFNCAKSKLSPGAKLTWGLVAHGDASDGSPTRGGIGSVGSAGPPSIHEKFFREALYLKLSDQDGKGVNSLTLSWTDMEGEELDTNIYYSADIYNEADGSLINMYDIIATFPGSSLGGGASIQISVNDIISQYPALKALIDDGTLQEKDLKIRNLHYYSLEQSAQLTGIELPPQTVPATDLIVRDEDGNSRTGERDTAGYAPADQLAVGTPDASKIEAPVYVLVSHGVNGSGAYLVDGTTNRRPTTDAGTLEKENADGDETIRDVRKINANDSSYFDDIVMWDTQFSLYGALPNGSCERAL